MNNDEVLKISGITLRRDREKIILNEAESLDYIHLNDDKETIVCKGSGNDILISYQFDKNEDCSIIETIQFGKFYI